MKIYKITDGMYSIFQDGSELCNRFSGITVGGLMEGTLEGQQLYPVHHQQQQQQPLHQHNSQQPFTVSSSLSQPVSQSQQFATSHAQFISVAVGLSSVLMWVEQL